MKEDYHHPGPDSDVDTGRSSLESALAMIELVQAGNDWDDWFVCCLRQVCYLVSRIWDHILICIV